MKTVKQKTDLEILTPAQRFAELLVLLTMVLLLGFFVDHHLTRTGFFTVKFGMLEMFCLYAPILISWIAPLVRFFGGRRNTARPFEAAMNLTLMIGSLWLWIVFPFNFAHLADVLPAVLRFAISWITDDIGRFVLILQVIIGLIAAPLTILTYSSVRRQRSAA